MLGRGARSARRAFTPLVSSRMGMSTKVIKGCTVTTADRTYKADVLIEGEKIKQIGQDLKGDEVIDATGAYVIPGGIDPHTHLEMPFMGTTAAETFTTGTFAAAAGGTTMLIDFCLPGADGSLLSAMDSWDAKSRDQISIDISYHMAVTSWNEKIFNEMEEVVKRGVTTFKHFMAYKGALMIEDDEMYASFKRCGELGAMALVHAENGDIVAELQEKYMAAGLTGPEGHAYSRPPEVEGEAANRAIMIADAAGVPLYIVHVSCEQAHEAIRRGRQKGMRVFGEPLIQHLTLDESEYFNKDWCVHRCNQDWESGGVGSRRVAPAHSPYFSHPRSCQGLCCAPCDVAAVPFQGASGWIVGRPCRRVSAGGRDRSRRLQHGAEALRPQGLPFHPQWNRGAGGASLGALDQGRGYGAADAKRVCCGHLYEHCQDSQHVPAEGRDPRRVGR